MVVHRNEEMHFNLSTGSTEKHFIKPSGSNLPMWMPELFLLHKNQVNLSFCIINRWSRMHNLTSVCTVSSWASTNSCCDVDKWVGIYKHSACIIQMASFVNWGLQIWTKRKKLIWSSLGIWSKHVPQNEADLLIKCNIMEIWTQKTPGTQFWQLIR